MVRRTSNNQPPTPPKGSGKGKHSSSPAKAKKRTNPVVKALGIVALVLVVAFVGVGAYAFSLLNKMSTAGEGDPIPGQASDFHGQHARPLHLLQAQERQDYQHRPLWPGHPEHE